MSSGAPGAAPSRVVRLLAVFVILLLVALLIVFPEARLAFSELRRIVGLTGPVMVTLLLLLRFRSKKRQAFDLD